MSNFDKIVSLIEELLEKGKVTTKGEVLFYCPVCKHRKRKLCVNINSGRWHCWICEGSLNVKGKTLRTLFTKFNAAQSQFSELRDLTNDTVYIPKTETQKITQLPKDFIPLREKSTSIFYRHAYNYIIKTRKLSFDDILKYNIGYCEDGKYQNRVILPSYDKDGKLNYFTARSFQPGNPMPYLNPPFSKDIIGFEFFINWKLPIVICESVFDAMAIKRNVIPLFGKTISNILYDRIILNNSKLIIYLDEDAKKNSIKIAQKFFGKIDSIFIAIPPQRQDPGSLTLDENWVIIYNATQINLESNFKDYIKIKLEN